MNVPGLIITFGFDSQGPFKWPFPNDNGIVMSDVLPMSYYKERQAFNYFFHLMVSSKKKKY